MSPKDRANEERRIEPTKREGPKSEPKEQNPEWVTNPKP